MRRIRIVCVSDTHNNTPRLPAGDVLIHAGDMTNQGSLSELRKTVEWIEAADFQAKIVIAGNHDLTLDPTFTRPTYTHRKPQEDPPNNCSSSSSFATSLALLTSSRSITYLSHTSTTIRLPSRPRSASRGEGGPATSFKVFGSPHIPRLTNWAFGYDPDDEAGAAEELWDGIPADVDVLVTHTPPRGHCDDAGSRVGCEALRRRVGVVRPLLVVCGHVHEGRGAERVLWGERGKGAGEEGRDLSDGVLAVERWKDPGEGNKRLSLVDLTGRREGSRRLENDGLVGDGSCGESAGDGGDGDDGESEDEDEDEDEDERLSRIATARIGRKETCIVNAALKRNGRRRVKGEVSHHNKPIVVDINLPACGD